MEYLIRYKTKSVLYPHPIHYLKVNKKNNLNNSINSKNIDEKNLKFLNDRKFGNDLTKSLKNEKGTQNQKLSSTNINQYQNKVFKLYNIFF